MTSLCARQCPPLPRILLQLRHLSIHALQLALQGEEGAATEDIEALDVMVNPNAHASAFEARALVRGHSWALQGRKMHRLACLIEVEPRGAWVLGCPLDNA